MLPMIDTVFGYFVAYLMVYAVLTGIWNMVLTKVVNHRTEQLMERDDGLSIVVTYSVAATNSLVMKVSRCNAALLPLLNVSVMLLWPLYLPWLIATGVYYAWKYLWKEVPAEPIEEAA